MRKLPLLLVAFILGVAVAACGSNKTQAPHLPPTAPATGTGIVQGHETTTRATTTR